MKQNRIKYESSEVENKESLETRKLKSWLKTVSAFANGHGGIMYFSINDAGILTGLQNAAADAEIISESIKTKIDPIPEINLAIHTHAKKRYIELQISAGFETPYYYIGDGTRTAFIRIGNESIPAGTTDLKRLILNGSNSTFDSLPTMYKVDRFSFTKFKTVFRQRTGIEVEDSSFLSFGLTNAKGFLTNAGLLFADESPLLCSRVFCTRWDGLTKSSSIVDALDDNEISGSLILLLQGAETFVRNNTKKMWRKIGTGRVEMPDYPERAVLECIVNALTHRDYLFLGSEVHIDIFDDRIESTRQEA